MSPETDVADSFEAGRTYFAVYYMDDQLRQPIVETLIYLGRGAAGEAEDPPGFVFQYAASFYSDGNWNDFPEEHKAAFQEKPIVSFPYGYREEILDVGGLIAELEELRQRA